MSVYIHPKGLIEVRLYKQEFYGLRLRYCNDKVLQNKSKDFSKLVQEMLLKIEDLHSTNRRTVDTYYLSLVNSNEMYERFDMAWRSYENREATELGLFYSVGRVCSRHCDKLSKEKFLPLNGIILFQVIIKVIEWWPNSSTREYHKVTPYI